MIGRLARLFGLASRPAARPLELPRVAVEMHWFDGTTLPLADWELIAREFPADADAEQRHIQWDSAARTWLDALGDALGPHYRVDASPVFLLLSPLQDRPARLFLATCQRMRAAIRRNLGGLAHDGGRGRHVVVVFAEPDDYYAYVDHYYPDGGEYAMSSGMFIQAGYGHFVMPLEHLDTMEAVIAHELTHCLVSHLPIPAWLNEGLAVNTERTLFPQLAAPAAQLYFPHEIAAQHAAYWDADTIQTFWSGKSFLAADDGNRLSYDLARKITALAAGDEPAFRRFFADADMRDGGTGAEHHLGYPLEHLVEAVLGDGDWRPRPQAWRDGIEAGQFRGRRMRPPTGLSTLRMQG